MATGSAPDAEDRRDESYNRLFGSPVGPWSSNEPMPAFGLRRSSPLRRRRCATLCASAPTASGRWLRAGHPGRREVPGRGLGGSVCRIYGGWTVSAEPGRGGPPSALVGVKGCRKTSFRLTFRAHLPHEYVAARPGRAGDSCEVGVCSRCSAANRSRVVRALDRRMSAKAAPDQLRGTLYRLGEPRGPRRLPFGTSRERAVAEVEGPPSELNERVRSGGLPHRHLRGWPTEPRLVATTEPRVVEDRRGSSVVRLERDVRNGAVLLFGGA